MKAFFCMGWSFSMALLSPQAAWAPEQKLLLKVFPMWSISRACKRTALFLYENTEEKEVATGSVGKLCTASESSGWFSSSTLSTFSRLGIWTWLWVALLFLYGIRESIEILVHSSLLFVTNSHGSVFSVLFFFSVFFFLISFFLGDKIGHLNKVLFLWIKRFLRARNHSKENMSTLSLEKPRDFFKYLLPNFLVLWLDVFWNGIVGYWIHFAILLFSSSEFPLPWTSTHY